MATKKSEQKDTVTTTVAFDRTTYKRLRLMAVERDTNVRALIREAVTEWLRRNAGRRSTK